MTTTSEQTTSGEPAVPGTTDSGTAGFLTRHRRAVVAAVVAVALVLVSIGGYALWAKRKLDDALATIHTEQVFAGIDPATRPAPSPDGGVTFLLAGADLLSAEELTGTEAGTTGQAGLETLLMQKPSGPGRSDIIILVHVDAARDKASLISIPRDSLVTIPSYVDASGTTHPAVRRKINASFSLGGPTLLVRTVEDLTGIRVDHFAYIDYYGLIKLVDAIGGVTVNNLYATSNVYGNPSWNFPKGEIPLTGIPARVWVSQRKNLPHSDLDRARNSQELLHAMALKLASPETFSNPVRLQSTLDLISSVVTVDETLDPGTMKGLALSMRSLDVNTIQMGTAPTEARTTFNGETVFPLDTSRTPCLWAAIRTSDLASVARCSAS